ncbi:hypothetical protein R1sor_010787 [Riccia sorocarpa]|uniref:Uncharacterized protein n=1 Tax=Riccia sorocarpa TaxID=122646 RepID=A0ABD3I0E6_9MARC
MGALTTAILAIAGLLAGWLAVEIACKPCLDTGRAALDRSLNPDYDPDDELPGGGSQGGVYTEAPVKKDEEEEVDDEDKPLKGTNSKSVTKDVMRTGGGHRLARRL